MGMSTTTGGDQPIRLRDAITHWRETAVGMTTTLIGFTTILTAGLSSPIPRVASVAAGISVLLVGLTVLDRRLREVSNATS